MKNITEDASVDVFYGPGLYKLDKAVLSDLKTLKPYKPVLAAIHAWFWIIVMVKSFLHFPQLVYFYPIIVLFIAGRAGVFLQLAHEAGHRLIASNAKFNDWFGNWIATYPIGLDLRGYAVPHTRHHACPNRPCDPVSDSEKYQVCDIRSPKLWFLFLKDLLGITAVTIRFLYQQPLSNKEKKDIEDYLETNDEKYLACRAGGESSWQALKKYLSIGAVQLVILGALFNFNLFHYVILWIVPLMTAHMFLMRVRGIAEHGLGIQLGVTDLERNNRGTLYTRSLGTPANRYSFFLLTLPERLLIGSLNVYYHHEHHLFPKVPYYNLPKLHAMICDKEQACNPFVFASGYFACLLFKPRQQPSH